MSYFKEKPFRSKVYRDWVATLPCAKCGAEDGTVVGHHLIGVGHGMMGGKACDLDLMPLCFQCHSDIHLKTTDKAIQYQWINKTLKKAIKEAIL